MGVCFAQNGVMTHHHLPASRHRRARPGSRGPERAKQRRERSRRTVPPGLPGGTVQSVLRDQRHNRDTVTRVRQWASGATTREVCLTVYIGIDWSQAKHDVCFLDEADEATVSQPLRTSPLPVTPVLVGDCWQNSR